MHQQTTNHPLVTISLTAHEDATTRILFASIKAIDRELTKQPDQKVALVLDRSGSMSGEKLNIAKQACARFLRSLESEDQVAVVTYDDQVDVVSPLARPSEGIARKIERIQAGGSTNLYGGWVLGAKMVGQGGKVVLLSDGLANVGRYTSSSELERHAETSYKKYGVATTTIGVGLDYDESLMAGMARSGGGSHYFAKTADKVMEAFSQERMASMHTSLVFVSLRYGSTTKELGAISLGESRAVVIPIERIAGPAATLRFTDFETGKTETIELAMPSEFGYSDEASLQTLIAEVADAEDRAAEVVHPEAAKEMAEHVRSLILRLLGHRMAGDPVVLALVDRLEDRKRTLEQLVANFDVHEALTYRKSAMQGSHNLRAPRAAYADDQYSAAVSQSMSVREQTSDDEIASVAEHFFQRVGVDQWRRWQAVPVSNRKGVERLAMANPKDGFLLKEIQMTINSRLRPLATPLTDHELELWLKKAVAR